MLDAHVTLNVYDNTNYVEIYSVECFGCIAAFKLRLNLHYGRGSCKLCRPVARCDLLILMQCSFIYKALMNPTLYETSVILCFECVNAVKYVKE